MSPIDDDEAFLHNVIHEGTNHSPSLEDDEPEDNGIQYLNDMAMAMMSRWKVLRKRFKPRYMKFMHI
jgi:hypothetical protein